MKNKNNIKGKEVYTVYNGVMFIPDCCDNCLYLDDEYNDYHILFYYCEKNIFFPTKKGTCKKQKLLITDVEEY